MIAFDHVIHYVKDLTHFRFPNDYLSLQEGGRHDTLGTFNYLSYFDLKYIEFIDIFDQTLVERASLDEKEYVSFASSLKRIGYQEGFVRMCFRTEHIEALKRHFNQLGLKTIGPNRMSRTKPDGTVLSWSLLYLEPIEGFDFELPFFIQWSEPEMEREGQLMRYFQPLDITDIFILAKDTKQMTQFFEKYLNFEHTEEMLVKVNSPNIHVMQGEANKIEHVKIKSELYNDTFKIHGGMYTFY